MRLKINYKETAFLLFFAGFFEPEYFTRFSMLNYFFRGMYYAGIMGMLYDIWRSGLRLSRTILILFGGYYVTLLLSTINYSGPDAMLLRSFIKTTAISMVSLNFIAVNLKKYHRFFFKSLSAVGEILLLMNLIVVILVPEGLYRTGSTDIACYLLGHKNQAFGILFVPMFAHAVYYGDPYKKQCSLRTFFCIFLMIIMSYLSKASMAMVCSIIMAALLWCVRYRGFRDLINIKTVTVGTLGVNCLICFFRIQNLLSFLIINVLNKDITLTSRTDIWDRAFTYFLDNMIWGVGYEAPYTITQQLGLSGTHNMIVGILFHSALIGIFVWGGILVVVNCKVYKYKMTLAGSIASIFMLIYLIQGISENILQPMKEGTMLLLLTLMLGMSCYASEKQRSGQTGEEKWKSLNI